MDVSTIVNIILCVLSFILAAISVVTVVITLRQNNKMIEESTRPFISVYTDEINAGNPFFYLVIKNFGKSTAYITKFEYDFDFNGCYKIRNDRDYLQQLNNAVLAPGQSRICTLDYQRIDRCVISDSSCRIAARWMSSMVSWTNVPKSIAFALTGINSSSL